MHTDQDALAPGNLAAYQSDLWNRMLAAWLRRTLGPGNLADVELKLGRVPVPVRVPVELRPAWDGLVRQALHCVRV